MATNDLEVDWREVAFLLNRANEALVEKIDNLNQKYSRLQDQCDKTQESEQCTINDKVISGN